MAIGLRYRLLNRATNGLGLSVSAEPSWTRVDDDTGERINGYSSEFVVASDTEVVPNFLVGVINARYEPEVQQSRVDGSWSRQNTSGLGAGLMLKLRDNVFAGLEARYLRRYDSADFSVFAGQAFFLGPTLSITLSETAWLTLGLSAQAAGRAVDDNSALDLMNFDRYQARVVCSVLF